MPRRGTDAVARRVAVLAVGAALLTMVGPLTPGLNGGTVAWSETQRISDGATATAPDRVLVGGKIEVNGKNWTMPAGGGSVIAVKLDDGEVERSAPVTNPETGEPVSDSSVLAAVRASTDGTFAISLSVPDDKSWTAGSRHSIRLLTGRLLSDDATRVVVLSFDLVGPSAEPSAAVNSPRSTTQPKTEKPPPKTEKPPPKTEKPPHKTEKPQPKTEKHSPKKPSATAGPTITPPASSAAEPTASATPAASATPTASASPKPEASGSVTARAGSAETAPDKNAKTSGEHPDPATSEPAPGTVESPTAPTKPSSSASKSSCGSAVETTVSAAKSIRDVPAADLGSVLTLTGQGFCHPEGGGSTIGVQIDDGKLARLDDTVHADSRFWQVVKAREDGTFDTTIRLPDRHETDPGFTDGSHRLQLLTGSLRAGDARRSVPTREFVVAPGNNAGILPEPAETPPPVDPRVALVGDKGRAVTVAQSGSTVRVVVPDLAPGDWVFPYAFDNEQASNPQTHPTAWLQVDADRSVTFDLATFSVAGAAGSRVSLQARDGTLVGWAQTTAFTAGAASSEGPVPTAADPEDSVLPPDRNPLVLLIASALLVAGLGWLAVARNRRRQALRDLNGE